MKPDVVIQVHELTKVYKLYNAPIDRLKEAISPFSRRKYHKDFYALNGVSFEIKKGDCVGVLGKNGAGKSTLLKILTGVLTQSSGSVEVKGKVSALLELGAGFNPEYTGMENIYFQGNIMGYSDEEISTKVPAILEFSEIGDFIHQPVKSYSSGMFARLAFSVAINVEPDILIVDEALSVGDMFFQAKCFSKFNEFQKRGITILFVTHSIDLVIKNCGTAILLDKGRICQYGATKPVVEEYRKLMVDKGSVTLKDSAPSPKLALDTQSFNRHNNPIEYGNRDIEILDFAMYNQNGDISNEIDHGEHYTVELLVRYNAKVCNPIFAYTVKTVDGLELTGTNTLASEIEYGEFEVGAVLRVRFMQTMILNSGSYLVSLGCTRFVENGNLLVMHRIYDAFPLIVIAEKFYTGVAFSKSTITIEK